MCLVILFGGFLTSREKKGCRPPPNPRQEEGSGSRDPDKPAPAAPERLSLEGRKHRDLGL